jgi:hypothetical protein
MTRAVPGTGEAGLSERAFKILAAALHGDEDALAAVFSRVRLLDRDIALVLSQARANSRALTASCV